MYIITPKMHFYEDRGRFGVPQTTFFKKNLKFWMIFCNVLRVLKVNFQKFSGLRPERFWSFSKKNSAGQKHRGDGGAPPPRAPLLPFK